MATIEIDGKQFEAENGKTIIEVADEHGIEIPRFCYHKKLSVAANCRMCLVEVDKSRKPLPACATPITDGMKVFTKSPMAADAQKAVMEFLLINHPLDCPVCDQGGECELQDVSLSFGNGYSEYNEPKRAVDNDNLGPLVATDMTRCIHCTRCVRFGEEVAGLRELGGTDRGENVHIGTFVKHSMTSEVSGNIIDLCPVGALTSKPFRFQARPWELVQNATIAPHDCLGSNIEVHSRRGQILRVVPKENEALNETWLSDRDRFSYLGLNNAARLLSPMVKREGRWEETDWETALDFAVSKIQRLVKKHGAEQFAALSHPSATLEEMYLLQKLMREQGINNLDHRLQQIDFADQDLAPLAPVMQIPYSECENQEAILIIGSHLNHELPLTNLRVRKAFRQNAKIMALNPVNYNLNYDLYEKIISAPQHIPYKLAQIVVAAATISGIELSSDTWQLLAGISADDASTKIAETLLANNKSMVILGAIAENHPAAATIRSLTQLLAQISDTKIMSITTGANAAGAWLGGMLPHRMAMGKVSSVKGLDAQAALKAELKGYLLLGIEAEFDIANPQLARQALMQAEAVIMLTAFKSNTLLELADVLLPIAPFAETSGTYVNIEGQWQSFKGVAAPQGEARPAWKILRVLGNLFHSKNFEYYSSEDVLQEIKKLYKEREKLTVTWYKPEPISRSLMSLTRIGSWPIYRGDSLLRHSAALQLAAVEYKQALARIHPTTVQKYNLSNNITISQNDIEITLPLLIDVNIAEDAVYIPNALLETCNLGESFGEVLVK